MEHICFQNQKHPQAPLHRRVNRFPVDTDAEAEGIAFRTNPALQGFEVAVRSVKISSSAGFIAVLTGGILTVPDFAGFPPRKGWASTKTEESADCSDSKHMKAVPQNEGPLLPYKQSAIRCMNCKHFYFVSPNNKSNEGKTDGEFILAK